MRIRQSIALATAVAVTFTVSTTAAEQEDFSDLPITRAVLYSSGVGYFEHAGTVADNATMRVLFKSDQINDVLKSMVLMDFDGGTVTSVTYPSNDPVDRALRSFGVDISGDPDLPKLLGQLRGAKVEVMAPDKISGSILNIETKTMVVGEPAATITEHILNLVTPTGIRSIAMRSINNLTLLDPTLRGELDQALALLVASRDTQRKAVDVRFVGQGKRRTRVGYVVETPVWKTSYRLDLSPGGDQENKPLLQGWAIVENTSDNDWKGVNLSLVSGRPISFVQDLYTPLYMPRPEVKPKLYASLKPRLYEEGMGTESRVQLSKKAIRRRTAMRMVPAAPAGATPLSLAGHNESADQAFALREGVQSVAYAEQLGELFHFTITHPVDLPRRRSAMLPIINHTVTAERVSIYNQSVQAKHPLNGVYLTNDTGMKMLGGPVTVFDAHAYAGDAQIDHLAAGDKRLLSYAIDLDVTVDPSQRSSNRITAARIVRGNLYLSRQHTYEQTYKIKNKADRQRQLLLEYPFHARRELIEPKTYEEKTPTLYRFRVPVAAQTTSTVDVRQHETRSETIAILDKSPDSLFWYTKQGKISKAVRKALEIAINLKHELTRLEKNLKDLQEQIKTIEDGQERLRRNIKSVRRDTELGGRYLRKLDDQETQIEAIEAQITRTREQAQAKRDELADYLKNLTVN